MSTDNVLGIGGGLFDDLREGVNTLIDKMESEQSKVNKALYEALTMEQRSVFLNKLEEQGVKRKRMESITGKEQSTINRTINRK